MHLLSQIIYFCKKLYMFRRYFRPSSGAVNCVYSNGICQTVAAACCYRGWDEILLILVKRSTCFGWPFRPSSGAENCVYSNGICQTAAATCCYRGGDEILFILVKRSTCFGWSFRPSSGAENCVYSNGICQTAAATCWYREWEGTAVPSHTVAVYAVLSSWWWTERPKHVEHFTRI